MKIESGGNYTKFPDGTLIQWGNYTSNGADYAIVFKIPFANSEYGLSYIPEYYDIGYYCIFHTSANNRVVLTFKNFDTNSVTGNLRGRWMATGRWK